MGFQSDTCELENIPDCSNSYQETGTLYYDRREMKSYLVGGLAQNFYWTDRGYFPKGESAKYVGTINELDIKNKVFSKMNGELIKPRYQAGVFKN